MSGRIPTEVNEVLEAIDSVPLRTSLKLLFLQSEQQHEENRDEQGKRHLENKQELDRLHKIITSGFPNGDPVAHCAYHVLEMERIKLRNEFYKALTLHLAKWGVVGLAIWLIFKLTGIKLPMFG